MINKSYMICDIEVYSHVRCCTDMHNLFMVQDILVLEYPFIYKHYICSQFFVEVILPQTMKIYGLSTLTINKSK